MCLSVGDIGEPGRKGVEKKKAPCNRCCMHLCCRGLCCNDLHCFNKFAGAGLGCGVDNEAIAYVSVIGDGPLFSIVVVYGESSELVISHTIRGDNNPFVAVDKKIGVVIAGVEGENLLKEVVVARHNHGDDPFMWRG